MVSMEKGSVGHNENSIDSYNPSPPARQSLFQKWVSHMKRFWWVHVILLCLGVMIVTLGLVYGAFPKIAQDGVDKSTLAITSLEVTAPTATTVYIKQNYIIRSNNTYHPHLDSFNASIGLVGKPSYGIITLPATDSGTHVPDSLEQTLQITDMNAFADYNRQLLGNVNVTQFVRGKTGLHEMAFPVSTVNYNQEVVIKGFNKLEGFNLTSFSILKKPFTNGTNAIGSLKIPNASDITVAMGNVTFNNYVDDTLVGNFTIIDLVLAPGDNHLPLYAGVDTAAVFPFISPKGKYSNGTIPLSAVAESSVYDGVRLIYYEYALKGQNQTIYLDVKAAIAAIA